MNGRFQHESIPWCLIFADDIVLVLESQDELNRRLEQWRIALEHNGLRISRHKSEYLRYDFETVEEEHNDIVNIQIGDQILPPQDSFKYLGLMLHKSGKIDEDVTHRIRVGWLKWRAVKGVLCDKKVPLKLKGKFFKVAIRPAMLYEVKNTTLKMREGRLRWFGHVLRRPPTTPVRRVETLMVGGIRRRGRPRCRLKDRLKLDMKELLLTEDMNFDRNMWMS
ncbi:uncharacterized protein [Rutidosis leptorrhynchoides]|uniref:uncharacterized protein n=1 Tax=Rutidosis leptorrhynchoides TaxID=125765 RepID=UPI003A99DF70